MPHLFLPLHHRAVEHRRRIDADEARDLARVERRDVAVRNGDPDELRVFESYEDRDAVDQGEGEIHPEVTRRRTR